MLELILTLALAQQPTPPACQVMQIAPVAEWRKQNPMLRFQGTAETRFIITVACPDLKNLADVPDDSWNSYTRDGVVVRIKGDAAYRITHTGEIEPVEKIFSGQGVNLRLPRDVFIRWLGGERDSADVRSHVYRAITGCEWGPLGARDARECTGVRIPLKR